MKILGFIFMLPLIWFIVCMSFGELWNLAMKRIKRETTDTDVMIFGYTFGSLVFLFFLGICLYYGWIF